MQIELSEKFDLMKTSKIDRKLIRAKLKKLKKCTNLEDFACGHIHKLKKGLTGMYGVRITATSRLILCPIDYDFERALKEGKKVTNKKFVIGVKIFFSPNHYKSIY